MTARGSGRVSLTRGGAIFGGAWAVEGDQITVELDGEAISTHLGGQKSSPVEFARVLLSELVDKKLGRASAKNIPQT